MLETFLDYAYGPLDEALITLGGKAYPKFGNVVILAGGAASGKSFIKDKLLGMEGFTFDVDAIKTLAMKSSGITADVKKRFGVDISKFDLSVGKNVADLHNILNNHLHLDDKKKTALYTSILTASPDRKPNLIFDNTMKTMTKLQELSNFAISLGYEKKNVHIVWVVNDVEVALSQNKNPNRGRVVPAEILIGTHRGASQTMNDIVSMGNSLRKYLDGDIVFAFNKIKVDSEVAVSGKGGSYIAKANYVYVKRAGKPVDEKKLSADLRAKVASYVPKNTSWI